MKIEIEISGIEEAVKLIEKINSLTAELQEALAALQQCPTFGRFDLNDNSKG